MSPVGKVRAAPKTHWGVPPLSGLTGTAERDRLEPTVADGVGDEKMVDARSMAAPQSEAARKLPEKMQRREKERGDASPKAFSSTPLGVPGFVVRY